MIEQQLTLFDTDTKCDGCAFRGDDSPCTHPWWKDCREGEYYVPISSTYCPKCGRKMGVCISALGSDWARCNCGIDVIFRNQGHRKGWLQAWRDGEVVGSD